MVPLKRGATLSSSEAPPPKKQKDGVDEANGCPPRRASRSEEPIETKSSGDINLKADLPVSNSSISEVDPATRNGNGRASATSSQNLSPSASKAHDKGDLPPGDGALPDVGDEKDCSDVIDPSFAELIKLEKIPDVSPLPRPALRDIAELESALQIGDKYHHGPDDGWKNDWSGNLQLYDKEVVVNRGYLISQPNIKPIKIPYCDWVAKTSVNTHGLRGLELLFSFVYHMKGTPEMAKKIMAHSLRRDADSAEQRLDFILDAIRRISYDPLVLRQDGWTTQKAESPDGGLGGAYLIGKRIIWQRYEALVIAFVRDDEFGALWKAVWLEDLDTFDLEAGELQEAMKKWENRQAKLSKKTKPQGARGGTTSIGSARFAASAKFTVDGIEHGIVLAASSSKASRGILWPARVRHVVEVNGVASITGSRRSSSKNLVQVVFLAPFWNGQPSSASKVSDIKDPYSIGPLFEYDTLEVSESTIQKYPFDALSMEKLQGNFRFLGLPKAVFSRYLDSHRLAVALKTYAMKSILKTHSYDDDHASASAALTESHILSIRTPIFPQVILDIPFDFILSKLPHPSEHASISMTDDEGNNTEPIIDIASIISSLSPPECFGQKRLTSEPSRCSTPDINQRMSLLSPNPRLTASSKNSDESSQIENEEAAWSLSNFASAFLVRLLQSESGHDNSTIDGLPYMSKCLTMLIANIRNLSNKFKRFEKKKQTRELKRLLCQCLLIKGHGEDYLECNALPSGMSKKMAVTEWRKACERVYKRVMSELSSKGFGNGITAVITDSRCNSHITANGSYERPVRLPAALKGAKMAGAGSIPSILLISKVDDKYLELAEEVIIPKAHKASYVKRIKTKIASLPADAKGVPLTEDSEGEGGEDTVGSRGSYTAATVGVAAALKAADMVVGGQCVNVFCAVRPPGHHAGRELRPMKAISNGFCLLNAAACAAIYATTPLSRGGLGLRRVCILDFDVHHGNGTQDILCSTFDPRFLYVSLHAGGAHINGFDDEDSEDESFRRKLGGKTKEGIYPGRCGDSSPHAGVLNIPLGQKVSATAVGTALVSRVSPKVEEFSPDLIILSSGFDAHKNDPLGMGGLSAEDFGSVTEVACQMAYKTCSGRILSVLEGGYGVPCCRPRDDLFLPENANDQNYKLLQLGENLPDSMDDPLPFTLRQKLDKCHAEGFLECVKEHVQSFAKCNDRK